MSIQQLAYILWARRWVVLGLFLATILTTLAVSLAMTKQYKATTTLVLDVQTPDRIMGMVLPGLMSPSYMATQLDIINSERVARDVVQKLNLDKSPAILKQWREEAEGKGTVAVWLGPLLQRGLEVVPSHESNVIKIEYEGSDPEFAAIVANGFAQAYVDATIELRAEPARKYAAWFRQQHDTQRERLEQAQKVLSDFQQKTGIVGTDERLDIENQRLAELTQQLGYAQAEGTDSSSKQSIEQSNDTLPEVMKNPLVLQLKGDVARLNSKLKELAVDYGRNHPDYRNVLAELNEMENRLEFETNRIAASISTAGKVSQLKVGELERAIDAQKQKMLELKNQRDQINLLAQEVQAAHRDYEAISQRLTQSQLEAQTVQTNVSVLTPAFPPLKPSKPMVFLNMVVALFFGALLAIGVALLLEMGRGRIRTEHDLARLVGAPVLGQLGRARISADHQVETANKSESISEPAETSGADPVDQKQQSEPKKEQPAQKKKVQSK